LPFGEYESFEDCVSKNSGKADPEAYCATIEHNIKGDTKRIAFDTITLQDKIIADDDNYLIMPAVIASEIVQQYEDGYAYKPAEELEKMAQTAIDIGSVPVKVLEHPGADTNYLLLKQSDVHGRAENFAFTKSLKDPKTGRPNRRGVTADIKWFKNRTPEKVISQTLDGTLRDVSIGFTFDSDRTTGNWQGQAYDYIQRNIFLNHVAAPIPKGRCAGPICGIGFDANLKFGVDELTLSKCPVCRKIIDVGILEASKNLYVNYGPEVLNVIDGKILPKSKPAARTESLDEAYYRVFPELAKRLEKNS
jgi:hypothetical protein